MNKITRMQLINSGMIVLAIGILSTLLLNYSNYRSISKRLDTLDQKLASTTADIDIDRVSIAKALNLQQQNVGTIEQKLGTYTQQISTVSSTVNTLQKLSKTDPELLAKYSKVFFLNENYVPTHIIEIPSRYKYSNDKVLSVKEEAWPFLQKMIENASYADIPILVDSAYRSFKEQKSLKSSYKVTYGAGTANQFSADQGYSEHQLGTTVDLTTTELGGSLDGFDKTKAYTWLSNNAYHFGFILSYPENNKFYVFEPWHWRFVGVKLATYLHQQNKSFYDMDQRDINEYLVSIFD